VLLVHQQTGAVRDAPWIALRTRDGCIYFANLLTRETRWLPPHLWMHGWVSRTKISDSRSSGSTMSQILDNGRDLPCDGRKPLPPLIAFKRVEGGAPYMYESTHGAPQYPPDESWDSQLTYPLEGNYVRWPRASTPDRRQVPPGYSNDSPSVHVGPKLWCTIAAADALDAREAAKPHRALGAPSRQSAISAYAAEPKDRSETPVPVTCLPSSLPLSSPSSPPPQPLPSPPPSPSSPSSPPSPPPAKMLQWEEIERERKDRDEEYLRMMELVEQDEAESLRIDLGLETTFANVGVSVINSQNQTISDQQPESDQLLWLGSEEYPSLD